VVHDYNSSYSGGRDQEDTGSRPAWANSLGPYLEKTHHITGCWIIYHLQGSYCGSDNLFFLISEGTGVPAL
jgi:hypothetical protein